MEFTEFTGKTVDEAVEKGLKELGLTEETAEIVVLEEGKKKLFGSVKARVNIAAKAVIKTNEETAQKTTKNEELTSDTTEDKKCKKTAKESVYNEVVNTEGMTDGERTVAFLEGLFDLLHITACTELVSEGEKVEINVTAANTTSIIGKHGAMLDAIQTLAGAVANTGRDEYKRVVVDCENYRENREATLNKLAENLAQKAIRLGKKIKLEPMNPYERRIIHAALSEREGVSTQSEGKEPNRYIVIIPDNLEDPNAPALAARNDRGNRGGRDNRNHGKGGYGRRDGGRGYGNRGGKDGYKKNFNRDKKPSDGNGETGGTTMKPNNDFFGIFLGNSNNEDK
ncbi:MAG: protein jag [Clostridia bacterium]|nr:protein jag [Clostridia bacterium]